MEELVVAPTLLILLGVFNCLDLKSMVNNPPIANLIAHKDSNFQWEHSASTSLDWLLKLYVWYGQTKIFGSSDLSHILPVKWSECKF